jgi:uncharacterized membrane protein (UPF0127 family)
VTVGVRRHDTRRKTILFAPRLHKIKTIGQFLFPLFFILLLEGGSAVAQGEKFLSLVLKEKKIKVEVVRTDEEKAKGLMFREKLGENEGMLFVFEREENLSFWMKNTRIPLSIAFIARNGKIVDIQDMEPFDLRSHVSARPAQSALEVNQGWFKKNGIEVGDSIHLPFAVPK